MRDFFGDLHCACLSFDLVLVPVTTPDTRREISGYLISCVSCSASFHELEEMQIQLERSEGDEPFPPAQGL